MSQAERRWIDRRGVTIVELLVVCGVLGVLLGLLLPALQLVREQARNVQCLNNERELGIGLHAYHEARTRLPAGWRIEGNGLLARGWLGQILPFVEQSAAQQISPRAVVNLTAFRCPSDVAESTFLLYRELGEHESSLQSSKGNLAELSLANYLGVFGNSDPDAVSGEIGEGAFRASRGTRWQDLTRGVSNVALVAERTARKLPATWNDFSLDGEDAPGRATGHAFLGPNRDDADECEFDSRHHEHINVLWGDGRATAVASSVDRAVYQAMARRE